MFSPTPYSPSHHIALATRETEDRALMARIAQKDDIALEQLYHQYAGVLYAMIVAVVHDRMSAEGLVQESFLQIWHKAPQYTAQGAPTAWIFRIARNKALDHLRALKVRPPAEERPLEAYHALTEQEAAATLTLIEANIEREYERQHLLKALAQLPPTQRNCLELAYFEGLTHREIAAFTHLPLGTIKSRIKTGIQQLKRYLCRSGYACTVDSQEATR